VEFVLAPKTTQLRRYEIEPAVLDRFVSWWKNELVPARIQHGFAVEFAFVDRTRSEFVWAVSVSGDEQRFLEVQERYNSSPERAKALETLPGIAATHVGFVEPAR
jgi:hypothetical protein